MILNCADKSSLYFNVNNVRETVGYLYRYLQFPNYLFHVYPDSLSIFVISVSFLQDISLSSVNEYIISASSHCSDVIMTFLQTASWISYGSVVQCQKICILCFVSTKYISFVTEYIISMAVQCSDIDLIQFQKIYIFCLFRQNISLLSPNTSFLWQCKAAMLIQHCFRLYVACIH